MRICSRLVWGAGIAVLALEAAGLPEPSHSVKLVVRADKSGRLVRSALVTPRAVRETTVAPKVIAPAAPAAEPEPETSPAGSFQEAVEQVANRHSLPPALVHSVIRVESNYNPYAVSSKGALGLMQLIPSTARRFGVANAFNPAQNLEGGARYLRYLLNLYHNDLGLALAAYNAGEGAVERYGGVPPYPETMNYLRQVARRLSEASLAARKAKAQQSKPAGSQPGGPNPIREEVVEGGRVHYVSR